MTVVGIICEYNPFHLGHRWQLDQVRGRLGGDCGIVCVMSGDFVQRGEPAVVSKFARARMAARCGADLVLELPVPWAIASAERFAMGGVSLLERTGVVDALAFGSECGDLQRLTDLALALDSREARELIGVKLASGMSYPAARELALGELVGADASLLRGPNNILAVEYLKALGRLGSAMAPLTVERVGMAHDGGGEGFASAMAIRDTLSRGGDVSDHMPPEALEILLSELNAGRGPVWPESLEQAVMYRLRTMPEADFAALPDSGEGLWLRLMRAARSEPTVRSVLDSVKTKRYAYARLRRMVLAAALGVTGEMQTHEPPYIRVLALGPRGREILRGMKKRSSLPLVTKPAAGKLLPDEARAVFELEARAGDIYALGCPEPGARTGGADWLTSVEINENT